MTRFPSLGRSLSGEVRVPPRPSRSPSAVDPSERIQDFGTLSVTSPPELVQEASEVFAADMVSHWIVNLFTLAIAALFVNNMLSRSVSERRLEFATLRAIGVSRRSVMVQVLAEGLARIASFFALGVCLIGIGWFYSRQLIRKPT